MVRELSAIAQIEPWTLRQEFLVYPAGAHGPAQKIATGPMLQKTTANINDELLRVVEWFNYVGDLRAEQEFAVDAAERHKVTTAASLDEGVRAELAKQMGKAPTDKAAEAGVRAHPDYTTACDELRLMQLAKARLDNLYSALDKRIDALRTISANMRDSQNSYSHGARAA